MSSFWENPQFVQFGRVEKLPQWHFWSHARNSKKKFGQKDLFWSIMKVPCPKNILRSVKSRILGQSKYKLRISSKRTHSISKILFNLGSYEYLASLESKIGKCLFLIFIIVKKQCGQGHIPCRNDMKKKNMGPSI